MKIKHSNTLMTAILLLLFCGSLFAQSGGLLFDIQEDQLTQRLELTPEQVETVKDILKMIQGQDSLDRQNFAGNAQALVAAAVRRAQMAEIKLFNDLDDSQKIKLNQIKEEQKKDREFFSLKEGLLLTADQAPKIKALLQVYASKTFKRRDSYNDMADSMDQMGYGYGYGSGYGYGPGYGYGSGYGMPGTMPGNYPGNYPGNVPGNMQNNMYGELQGARRPNPAMMNEDLIEDLRNHEADKEKAIEQLLTPEQKVLFNQLKEVRHKELKMMMDKIRDNRDSQ